MEYINRHASFSQLSLDAFFLCKLHTHVPLPMTILVNLTFYVKKVDLRREKVNSALNFVLNIFANQTRSLTDGEECLKWLTWVQSIG